MIQVRINEDIATLQTGKWQCPNKRLELLLNELTTEDESEKSCSSRLAELFEGEVLKPIRRKKSK